MGHKRDILKERLNEMLGKPKDFRGSYTPEEHLKLLEIQDKNYEYPVGTYENGYMIQGGLRNGFMPKDVRKQADEHLREIRKGYRSGV